MALCMCTYRELAVIIILFTNAHGLYEDQAGIYDWKQDYVGKVSHVVWESSSSSKKLFVATELNALAALNMHDGTIAWRQVAEEGPRGKFDTVLYNGNNVLTVQAGGSFVRSWHSSTGNVDWEVFLDGDEAMSAPAIFQNADKESLVIAAANMLVSLKTSDGKKEWETLLPDNDGVERWFLSLQPDGDFVVVGVLPGVRITVVTVSPDGKLKVPHRVPAQWIKNDTSCQTVNGLWFLCYTPESAALQLLALTDGKVFIAKPLSDLGFSPTSETALESVSSEVGILTSWLFLRVSLHHMALLNVSSSNIKVLRDMPKVEAADVAYDTENKVLLTVQRADPENVEFTGLDLTTMTEQIDVSQRISILESHGSIEKIFPMLFTKKKDLRLGAKVVMVAQDYSLHCANKAGKAPWRREEAMAYINNVEMVDLPVSENEAKFEDEFGSSRDDILAMFLKRLKVQILQLQGFVQHIIQKLAGHRHHHSVISKNDAGDIEEEEEEEDLVRDAFSLHKMIVAVTTAGKIYGVRSHNGKIAWQHFFPDLVPFERHNKQKLLLFIQRTTAHFPHSPQCAVLGISKVTGNGLIFTLNPVTGAVLGSPTGIDLGFKVIQAEMIGEFYDQEFLRGILLVDSDIEVHFFPASMKSVMLPHVESMYFHLTDVDAGTMNGYHLLATGQDIEAELVWNIDFQHSQQVVTGVYSKRPIEHVHSQGRVLGDRSVLYKYLNPNLVVVVAEGEEPASATNKGPSGFFNVYLVDVITGQIIFHENHKRSHGPVQVVHSENWVVYSFYSEKHRRVEIAVLELYEGKEQSNSTAFSSLDPPLNPLVLRQAYIFPVPLYTMASTVTEKGITNKNLIIALKIGGVLSLPKAFLDPRRPTIPTPETMEEGTIPYIPELAVNLENIVNYNRSIFHVHGIHTAPAGLESTSLILVYGIDLFYTRATPSKMFDVLKEDFDYVFIAIVLFSMIAVSLASQNLAARRALKRAWK